MANSSTIPYFTVRNRTDFKQCLNQTEARNPCDWNFCRYTFNRKDVALIKQLSCRGLFLRLTDHGDRSSGYSLRQEILAAFLALENVEQLNIDGVTRDSFFVLPNSYRIIYRSPISRSLKNVFLGLPADLNHSFATGLKYATGITTLMIYGYGHDDVKYMYRYFSSARLREIMFRNASAKDCIALLREKRATNLEIVKIWGGSVHSSKLTSKYASGALLKEPTVTKAVNTFFSLAKTELAEYQRHLFDKFGVNLEWR